MLPAPFHLIPNSAQRHRHLDAGELAFRQGDTTLGLFYVLQGSLELRRFTQAGQSVIIHRAKSGETFAEASLFSPNYHCDAIAMSNCHLIEMERAVILDKFNAEIEFAMRIAKRFAQQNQFYRRKLELLAIKSAQERIYMAVVEGYLTGNIKAFAAEIALSHEVVYRGLAKLVDNGKLVKIERGKYRVGTDSS